MGKKHVVVKGEPRKVPCLNCAKEQTQDVDNGTWEKACHDQKCELYLRLLSFLS